MSRERIVQGLLFAAVFFLPWQTRWIYDELTIAGQGWEYGKLSLYATELLVLSAFLLRGRLQLSPKYRQIIFSFGAVIAIAAFFSFISTNATLSVATLTHLLCAFLLLLLVLDERTAILPIAWAFVLSLVAPALLGWFQVLTGTSPASTLLGLASHAAPTVGDSVIESAGGRTLRAYGSFPHPNILGGFLVIGLFLLAFLAREHRYEQYRAWFSLLNIVFSVTLVMTFSRSAYLAATIGACALIAWLLIERRAPPRKAFPSLAVGFFSLLLVIAIFHEPISARFHPELRLEARSIAERQVGYRDAWKIIRAHPVAGVGVGAFTHALANVRPGEPVWAYQPVHNVFLLVLAELGLLGLAALLAFMKYIFHPLWLARRMPEGILAISLATALIILALFDHYLWSQWSGIALALLALGLGQKMIRPSP